MHKLFYYAFRTFLWFSLRAYFRKISVQGTENIPINEPVMFLANHQNAFLDAVVIVCHNQRYTHFLARADVFKSQLAIKILSLLNIYPIYRQRDGLSNLGRNLKVFDNSSTILTQNGSLIMFPEGNQSDQRRIRPISKGFTRIAYQVLDTNPTCNLKVVPVGINYLKHSAFRTRVSVLFGKPLNALDFYKNSGSHQDSMEFRSKVKEELEELTWQINDEEYYDEILNILIAEKIDLSDPKQAEERVSQMVRNDEWANYQFSNNKGFGNILSSFIYAILNINGLLVNLFWLMIRGRISDPLFTGSIKYSFVTFILPLILLFQIILIAQIHIQSLTFSYILFCLLFPWYLKFYDDLK